MKKNKTCYVMKIINFSNHICYRNKKNLLNIKDLSSSGFEQHAEILCKVIKKGDKFYEVPISYNGRNYSEGKKIKSYHLIPVLYQIIIGRFR